MIFSSLTFIFAFLPVVWVVFHLLKNAKFKKHYTFAKVFLIVASLFFYAYWKLSYLPILLSSIIVNYCLAQCVLRTSNKVFNVRQGGGDWQNSTPNLSKKIPFKPKFYFVIGVVFNLCLLGFFKYTDFFLENFNAFSQIAHLDFNIPLPHILLPLALSFVTFQQIAFLYDCFKRTKGELKENLSMDFIDYALFISFFPQLIAGPIVHHREMMPQFARMGNTDNSSLSMQCDKILDFSKCTDNKSANILKNPKSLHSHTANTKIVADVQIQQDLSLKDNTHSAINYEFLAKGLFIFAIGLFKKTFIADSFAKWANAGFSVVEKGEFLNIAESWATSLSYTFQLYFDFSGYCDMAIGLGLMFGIVLPLNFNSPYKSLNITEFWRRWHITLGRFLTECVYIPLGGNRVGKILNLRNIFIVFFLSGIWHGAGWGFIIWGTLHALAMMTHRVYKWFYESLDKASAFVKFMQTKKYKVLCWLLTFNFISLAWVFFRAENLQGAINLLKGMFGVVWVALPEEAYKIIRLLDRIDGRDNTILFIVLAFVVCLVFKNSFERLQNFNPSWKSILFVAILLCVSLCSLLSFSYSPFIYFNF